MPICPICGQVMVEVEDGSGGTVWICPVCEESERQIYEAIKDWEEEREL